MKILTKSVTGAVILTALTLAVASVALAHSFPEEESPAAGATLATPPAHVTIKYDAPIEKLFDSLKVLDASGNDKSTGAPLVSDDGLNLSVPVASLSPGQYTVQWRVVCIDTHHTQGSYSFTVK